MEDVQINNSAANIKAILDKPSTSGTTGTRIGDLEKDVGTVSSLKTGTKTSIVDAINWAVENLGGGDLTVKDVTITGTSAEVTVAGCKSTYTGAFHPDKDIADLVQSSTVTCGDGKITVTIVRTNTSSTYPIFGDVVIYE